MVSGASLRAGPRGGETELSVWQGHEEEAVAGEQRRRRGREIAVASAGLVIVAVWEGEGPSPRAAAGALG